MCGIGTDWINQAAAAQPLIAGENSPKRPISENALIIFVKNPQLGKVKTRLAKTMGAQAALDAYLLMLRHAHATASAVDCDRWVFYSDFVDDDDLWTAPAFFKALQPEGDIGAKMQGAICDLLGRGYVRVALVGSDLLDIQPQHLAKAFRALEHYDTVFGPAQDGGYYLIGMKEDIPSIFRDKSWSTESVLSSTLVDIAVLEKTAHLIATLSDIDTEADWLGALDRWERRREK